MGTAEMENLLYEKNYVDCDVLSEDMPFPDNDLDGILCQHMLEHLACHDAVMVLEECRKKLKPGGMLAVSVPDADYFLKVHSEDTRENAVRLFGEPIHDPVDTFFDYALFRNDHIQVLNKHTLRCLMIKAGFNDDVIFGSPVPVYDKPVLMAIEQQLNRLQFSAILFAYKL